MTLSIASIATLGRVLVAESSAGTTRVSDLETLGPLTMSHAHWQLFGRAASTIVTIAIAMVLVRWIPALERFVIRFANKHEPPQDATASTIDRRQRFETLTRVTSSIAQAVIWTTTVIVVLGNVGIAVGPLLATAGIAGVAIGFGAQTIVKDFFAGFFILLENQFDVGDTVTLGAITGTVERMTMRITVVREASGTAYFIPNSNISNVANKTYGWGRAVVDAPFACSVAEADARALLDRAATEANATLAPTHLVTEPVAVEGPVEFSAASVTWRLATRVRPDRVGDARSAMIRALARAVRETGFVANGAVLERRDRA